MRRIMHGTWFIQSQPTRDGQRYIAWASKDRTDTPMAPSIGDVYFDFGKTESEAIEKIIAEITTKEQGEGGVKSLPGGGSGAAGADENPMYGFGALTEEAE